MPDIKRQPVYAAQWFEQGVEHFNAGRYWEAHESWEKIWLDCRDGLRDFLQGLIQLTAAWYHVRRGNFRGAARLFSAARNRLDRYPADFCGLDRAAAEERSAEAQRAIAGGLTGIETPLPDATLQLTLLEGWTDRFDSDR
jgi:predicted metal-dependent hydrolase